MVNAVEYTEGNHDVYDADNISLRVTRLSVVLFLHFLCVLFFVCLVFCWVLLLLSFVCVMAHGH